MRFPIAVEESCAQLWKLPEGLAVFQAGTRCQPFLACAVCAHRANRELLSQADVKNQSLLCEERMIEDT